MVWSKFDDGTLDNPKIAQVGALGFALHAAAIIWANRNLTDGLVPKAKLRTLIDWTGVSLDVTDPSGKRRRLVGAELVEHVQNAIILSHLFHDRDTQIEVHDILKYNPSRESVLSSEDKYKKSQSDKGKRSAEVRREKVNRTSTGPQPDRNRTSTWLQPDIEKETENVNRIQPPDPGSRRENKSSIYSYAKSDLTGDPPGEVGNVDIDSMGPGGPPVDDCEPHDTQEPCEPKTPANGNAGPAIGPKSKVQKRARKVSPAPTRLPADWQPSEALVEYAHSIGQDPIAHAVDFKDYWASNGGTKVDWDATFRMWMRKSKDYGTDKPWSPPREVQKPVQTKLPIGDLEAADEFRDKFLDSFAALERSTMPEYLKDALEEDAKMGANVRYTPKAS